MRARELVSAETAAPRNLCRGSRGASAVAAHSTHGPHLGEFRWLTVVSSNGYPDVELVLEPNANPAAKAFQEAMFKQGIPLAAFEVDDIEAEAMRLKKVDVKFTMDPKQQGPVKLAIFSDTCGNLIQMYQPPQNNA